jgi:hypothetical protein
VSSPQVFRHLRVYPTWREERALAAIKFTAGPAEDSGSDADANGDSMRASYAIFSGRRQVGVMTAWSAGEALIEYLRGRGFRDDEMVRMRFDAVSWRGAIFTASKIVEDSSPA